MSDPRFARLKSDPRFRRPKKHQNKVVVDERFKSLFENDKKSGKGKAATQVDKYGRKVSKKEENDDLRRFYRLEGEDDEGLGRPDYARGEVLLESSDEEEEDIPISEEEDDGEVVLGRVASKPIIVTGDDDEQLEVDLNEDDDAAFADLDAQAEAYSREHQDEEQERTGIRTNRIAVVNLDWDHVRASHLYRVFSSLVSPSAPTLTSTGDGISSDKTKPTKAATVVRGKVLSVRVYPSEFGKERMKKEEVEGPPKEIFKKSRREDVLGGLIEEDEGDEADEEALRKYQLERLRYYYAIVTCDSVEAASHIYSELDGTELERTANVLDLSFVPDDLTFDSDFRDEATPATENTTTNYKTLDFSTDALRHSKVKLHWDEDDPERNKVTRRTLTKQEIEEGDYRAFIASSDSEDSQDEAAVKKSSEREKLRSLLLGGNGGDLPEGWDDPFGEKDEKAEDGDIEITFMPGLSEKKVDSEEETTLDKYKRKQKEKRLERKKKLKEIKDEKGAPKKKEKKIDDEFFSDGSDEGGSGGGEWTGFGAGSDKEDQPSRKEMTKEELALLVAADDPSKEPKHFDMKAILKAEKLKGKKAKRMKKKGAVDEEELQQEFQLDVTDERFRALHEDHTFAIDPSNPHFKKTKGMSALLEERAKRQQKKLAEQEQHVAPKAAAETDGQSLKSLVESVKRKTSSADQAGAGKRRKL